MANGRSRANLPKLIGAQGSATHQSTVHVRHGKKFCCIAGFYAAAVKNPQTAAYLSIKR
jgi:hypothetical protein